MYLTTPSEWVRRGIVVVKLAATAEPSYSRQHNQSPAPKQGVGELVLTKGTAIISVVPADEAVVLLGVVPTTL